MGDPTGKSYGDVAFMEHYNLESNIKCENYSHDIFTCRFVFSCNFVVVVEDPVTIITYSITLCLSDGQIWKAVAGPRAWLPGILSCCVQMDSGLH